MPKVEAEPSARKGRAVSKAAGPRRRRSAQRAPARVSEGPEFGRKNWILLGLALGTIALGYVALAMGSITLAPILLVVGYVVLVPWAVVARSEPDSRSRGE